MRYHPELPICKDDPGLDVGLPDFVHNLCALFPQVCDGEDVPPGSDSLPGNFSLPDVCGALPDLFFCRGNEIPEDWESMGVQICNEIPEDWESMGVQIGDEIPEDWESMGVQI